MAAKFYAVRKGKKPGIYMSWDMCKQQTDGFPGAEFKSFPTREAAEEYIGQKHQTVEIIKLNGSVELAPIVGLSEVIVDIVETGATLRENGLEVLEEVCPLSARIVVNQVSMKMENERITKLINDIKNYLENK